MFVLKQNIIIGLTRCTKNIYKSIYVINNFNVFECHQNIFSQYPVKQFSSQPLSKDPLNVDKSTNTKKDQEEDPSPLSIDFDIITKGDKELEYKLKVIMLETEVLRQEGRPVPEPQFLTPETWENLLKLPTRSSRMKYLGYLFKTSKKIENRLVKKLEKRKNYEDMLTSRGDALKHLPVEEHALNYGLLQNCMFIRFHDTTINHFYNSRLIQAMQFGQKLVIDCGYDQDMTTRENQNTAKQLMLLFAENRIHDEPFDIHYANINKESDLTKMLHKYVPTMYDMEFPMNVHEKSYLDLFPQQKLVYLTPHCREEMNNFDHDAIYIIGAIVDKVNNEPLSLAKAKREGLTMKKFPLDRYLQWGSGSGKSLTINQCVAILLDLKATNDWNYALRHVPKRKIIDPTSVNKFKSFSNGKQFSIQRNNTWKPKSNKHTKISVSKFYD